MTYSDKLGVGGVVGIPIIKSIKYKTPKLLLIDEYRAPADSRIISFPAGLVNTGEDPELSVIRELKEETGYTVKKILKDFGNVLTVADAKKSDDKGKIYFVEIDADDPDN